MSQAPVFVVADALVLRHVAGDPLHPHSRRVWAHLSATRPPLVTISAQLDAAATTLARVTEPAFAAARARHWQASQALQVIIPDDDDRRAAYVWLERWRDPGVDMADCLAWAVMTRLRVATAVTWREPYRWAGFGLLSMQVR
jgi:predicted nucleic acid-binding protein